MTEAQRTLAQNNSLHLYFEMVAKALNDAGITHKKFYENFVETPWSKETIKETWKDIQWQYINKRHTSELTTKEVNECYDVFNVVLSPMGIHVPFPSIEEQFLQEEIK